MSSCPRSGLRQRWRDLVLTRVLARGASLGVVRSSLDALAAELQALEPRLASLESALSRPSGPGELGAMRLSQLWSLPGIPALFHASSLDFCPECPLFDDETLSEVAELHGLPELPRQVFERIEASRGPGA